MWVVLVLVAYALVACACVVLAGYWGSQFDDDEIVLRVLFWPVTVLLFVLANAYLSLYSIGDRLRVFGCGRRRR